jgi:hypothetical protein
MIRPEPMIANCDKTAIIAMLIGLAFAIVLVTAGLVQDHYSGERPDARACECP